MLERINKGERNGEVTTVGSTLNALNSDDRDSQKDLYINKDLNQLFASAKPVVGNRRASQNDVAKSKANENMLLSKAQYAPASDADGFSASPDVRVRNSHDSVTESQANGFALPSIKRITAVSKPQHIENAAPSGIGFKINGES